MNSISKVSFMRLLFWIVPVLLISGCAPQPSVSPLPSQPCLKSAQLNRYSYDALARVAASLRTDAKSMDDFSGFINGMKGNVDNYASMIESSVYLTNVVRFLPIPYAGEVSNSAKLVSKTLLHLNSAAVGLDRYRKSSATFLEGFDKLDPNTATAAELSKLALFADTQLLCDEQNLQISLQKISSSATAIAAAAQSISDAIDSTGDYVNHAKGFVGFSKSQSKEKVRVEESRDSFKSRLALLSKKIAALEHSADTQRESISKARIYAELSTQL